MWTALKGARADSAARAVAARPHKTDVNAATNIINAHERGRLHALMKLSNGNSEGPFTILMTTTHVISKWEFDCLCLLDIHSVVLRGHKTCQLLHMMAQPSPRRFCRQRSAARHAIQQAGEARRKEGGERERPPAEEEEEGRARFEREETEQSPTVELFKSSLSSRFQPHSGVQRER